MKQTGRRGVDELTGSEAERPAGSIGRAGDGLSRSSRFAGRLAGWPSAYPWRGADDVPPLYAASWM